MHMDVWKRILCRNDDNFKFMLVVKVIGRKTTWPGHENNNREVHSKKISALAGSRWHVQKRSVEVWSVKQTIPNPWPEAKRGITMEPHKSLGCRVPTGQELWTHRRAAFANTWLGRREKERLPQLHPSPTSRGPPGISSSKPSGKQKARSLHLKFMRFSLLARSSGEEWRALWDGQRGHAQH